MVTSTTLHRRFTRRRKNVMSTLSRWILSHKLIVVLFWLATAIAGVTSSSQAVNALSQQFTLPGREAYETNHAIVKIYGNGGGDTNPLVPVITLPAGTTVDTPGVREQLRAAFARANAAIPHARVSSYATTGNPVFISHDRRTTFGVILIKEPLVLTDVQAAQDDVRRALKHVTIAGAHFHLTGLDALALGDSGGSDPSVLIEILLGGLGALLILIFVFRSFMAVVPLLMVLVAIPTTFLLVWGLTAVTDVSVAVEYLVAFIGLGVAIDYSLLMVMRWREERARGLSNEAAVQRAMETAGTAVIFSGTTVAIGLLALIMLPVPFLRSMGYGGILIPLVSVVVALTLLPVLLATVGPRLDWPRGSSGGRASVFWTRWASLIVRARWQAASIGIAILAVLLYAASQIALGQPKADSLAQRGDARMGLVALERSGIGNGVLNPFEVLVEKGNPNAVARAMARVDGVQGAVAPTASSWHRAGTSLVSVFPVTDASSARGRAIVDHVREAGRAQGGDVRVGGASPLNADFIDAIYGNFPLMIVLIGVATFLLLARAFRSLVLPLKAILPNVLSVGR